MECLKIYGKIVFQDKLLLGSSNVEIFKTWVEEWIRIIYFAT
jgi:hypothetical protein